MKWIASIVAGLITIGTISCGPKTPTPSDPHRSRNEVTIDHNFTTQSFHPNAPKHYHCLGMAVAPLQQLDPAELSRHVVSPVTTPAPFEGDSCLYDIMLSGRWDTPTIVSTQPLQIDELTDSLSLLLPPIQQGEYRLIGMAAHGSTGLGRARYYYHQVCYDNTTTAVSDDRDGKDHTSDRILAYALKQMKGLDTSRSRTIITTEVYETFARVDVRIAAGNNISNPQKDRIRAIEYGRVAVVVGTTDLPYDLIREIQAIPDLGAQQRAMAEIAHQIDIHIYTRGWSKADQAVMLQTGVVPIGEAPTSWEHLGHLVPILCHVK